MKMNRFLFPISAMVLFSMISCMASLEARKGQGEASRKLGEALMEQGDITLALRELLEAEALYPNDPFLQNDLGLVYGAKEEYDLAIRHFKRAVKLNPSYAPARNNLGVIYLTKEDWDEAIKCFKAITGDLLYAAPHYPLSNLALAYYGKGSYELAEKNYLEALRKEPDYAKALHGLGKTYVAMGRVPEALVVFERAVRRSPRSPQLHFDTAHAHALAGDHPNALAAYNRVVELAPASQIAIEAEEEAARIRGAGRPGS